MALEYYRGAELPNADITWKDSNGNIIDFSSGWTFTVRIGQPDTAALVTKTTGITGSASDPNIVISWAADELASLTTDTYQLDIIARSTVLTNKDRIQSTSLVILAAVNP